MCFDHKNITSYHTDARTTPKSQHEVYMPTPHPSHLLGKIAQKHSKNGCLCIMPVQCTAKLYVYHTVTRDSHVNREPGRCTVLRVIGQAQDAEHSRYSTLGNYEPR